MNNSIEEYKGYKYEVTRNGLIYCRSDTIKGCFTLIQGMNLGSDDSVKKSNSKKQAIKKSRVELRQIEKEREYNAKQHEPYNRTFSTPEPISRMTSSVDVSFEGRVERSKYRKSVRRQTSFVSWVMGLFSGLIALLLLTVLIGGSDVSNSWNNRATATPMIIENPQQIETESAEPTITPEELEILELKEALDEMDLDDEGES